MANIGRNDPCPCGSGRKYKQCCLQKADAERSVRLRLRAAEARVVPALLSFALENWGETLVEHAWKEFVLWNDDDVPDSLSDDPDFYPLFLPWFLFTHIADPYEEDAPQDLPDVPIGLAYLDEHDDIDHLDRRLIQAACSGGFSFHSVRGVTGEAIELKDILTGAETRVLEQNGAQSVHPGDILFAFPVTAGGGAILLGCAPLVIPPPWHNRIIDFREERWDEEVRPTAETLGTDDVDIRELYFDIADAIYNPQPPTLTNTDGEPIELTTLTYDLRCSAEEAFAAFKTAGSDRGPKADEDEEVERNDDGTIARATVRWLNDKEMLLATVTIEPGVLRAEVNSAARAARIKEEIASHLGDRAALGNTTTLPADEMIANLADPDESGDLHADREERSPELEAIEADIIAKHWESWIDEPVPALANETPREAARTELGRERLEALFAEYRWRAERMPPHLRVDVDGLRRRLGL